MNIELLDKVRKKDYSATEIAEIICKDNTCLLHEPEIKEILWMWQRDREELKAIKKAP